MFRFFSKKAEKREVEQLKHAVQTGFNSVKQDINSLTKWIRHLDSRDSCFEEESFRLREELTSIKDEFENLKNIISLIGNKHVFKQRQTVFNKQTAVGSVLNSVQTAVQTAFLDNLTSNERSIIFILLNSDIKLSYEDIAAILGKEKSTIRGQINSIRQKSEGLIEEIIGENNKKRVYVPEKIKETLLKSRKVRDKSKKMLKNNENRLF